MSSPVVAVDAGDSMAVAWEAMRSRRMHHLVVLAKLGMRRRTQAAILATELRRTGDLEQ